jgi:hypothetical protein
VIETVVYCGCNDLAGRLSGSPRSASGSDGAGRGPLPDRAFWKGKLAESGF